MDVIKLKRQREVTRVQSQVQRAIELGLEATLTLDEWLENVALFNGLCAYCQVSSFDALDHIYPVTRGGGTTKDNSVPACKSCNSKKSMRLDGTIITGESLVEAVNRIRQSLKDTENITSSIELLPGSLNDQEHQFKARIVQSAWDSLEFVARQEERSINWIVVQAVREYTARYMKKVRKPPGQEDV